MTTFILELAGYSLGSAITVSLIGCVILLTWTFNVGAGDCAEQGTAREIAAIAAFIIFAYDVASWLFIHTLLNRLMP